MRINIDSYNVIWIVIVCVLAWTWVRADSDCSELCKRQGMYGETYREAGCEGGRQRVTCTCKKLQ